MFCGAALVQIAMVSWFESSAGKPVLYDLFDGKLIMVCFAC